MKRGIVAPTTTTTYDAMAHTDKFSMPVIAASNDYTAINNKTTVAANGNGIDITITNATASEQQIFAVMGGRISWYPGGTSRFGLLNTGAGMMILETYATDLNAVMSEFPVGTPRPFRIVYDNITKASALNIITPLANAAALPKLNEAWKGSTNPPPSLTQLRQNMLDRMMKNEWESLVEGGTPIGLIALDSNGTAKTTIWFLDADNTQLTQLPFYNGLSGAKSGKLTAGTGAWKDHTLITKTAGFPITLDIYVKLESWNYGNPTNGYVPLANVEVELWQHNSVLPDQKITIPTGGTNSVPPFMTNADGLVHIHVDNVSQLNKPDLYFKAKTNGVALPWNVNETYPVDWPTRKWKTADGQAGFYPSFFGGELGTSTAPLTFRVGLDFHFTIQYYDERRFSYVNAPPGVPVDLMVHRLLEPRPVLATEITNADGEVHGIAFGWFDEVWPDIELEGEEDLFVSVRMEMTPEPSINMKACYIYDSQMPPVENNAQIIWERMAFDPAHGYYKANVLPSFGTPKLSGAAGPIVLKVDKDTYHSNAALFALKIYREWSIFLNTMTNLPVRYTDYTWKGVELVISLETGVLPPNSFSPIRGGVLIAKGQHFQRDTLFHEISHQIMWQYIDMVGLELFINNKYYLYHHVNIHTTPQEAFAEGWAELFEFLVLDPSDTYYPMRYIHDLYETSAFHPKTDTLVGTLEPFDKGGEHVEGALAYPLWSIFRKHVYDYVAPALPAFDFLHESVSDGNVADPTINPWLTNTLIRTRFTELIWSPLVELGKVNNYPGLIDYINKMWEINPDDRPKLKAEFYAYNTGVPSLAGKPNPGVITVTSMTMAAGGSSVLTGPKSGNTVFLIEGNELVDRIRTTYHTPSGSPVHNTGIEVTFVKAKQAPVTAKKVKIRYDGKIEVTTPAVPVKGTWEIHVSLLVRNVDVGRISDLSSGSPYTFVFT